MAMQTKLHSLIESAIQVFIGYLIAIATQFFIFPYFGIDISTTDHLMIGMCFLIVSLTRQYFIRRWWSRRTR